METQDQLQEFIVHFMKDAKAFSIKVTTSSHESALKIGSVAFPDARVTHIIKNKTPKET
jgi:hypothetical protein